MLIMFRFQNPAVGFRELRAAGYTTRELAEMFDVSMSTIYRVVHKYKWVAATDNPQEE